MRTAPVPAVWLLILLAALISACGIIGSTGADGRDDQQGPYDRPLLIDEVSPSGGNLPMNPTIQIHFNEYLEDGSFTSFDAATLRTGDLSWAGWTDYVMTDKTLVWEARNEVPADLQIDLTVGELESVTGETFPGAASAASYMTSMDASADDPPSYPSTTWSAVREIVDERCADCHGDADWPKLNPLTHASLVGRSSDQVDTLLVRPYDPSDSYLMHKLLWDYPVRRGEPQPPAWDGGEQLPRQELLAIEGWIAAGAGGPE